MGRIARIKIAFPVKMTRPKLDQSISACARSTITNRVRLEKKDLDVFWYKFEKNGESVLVHDILKISSKFWGK